MRDLFSVPSHVVNEFLLSGAWASLMLEDTEITTTRRKLARMRLAIGEQEMFSVELKLTHELSWVLAGDITTDGIGIFRNETGGTCLLTMPFTNETITAGNRIIISPQ